jgi:hypothetical protein
VSEPAPNRELECFLLRYVPNVLTGEFVNIALVMWESGEGAQNFRNVRLRQDWNRVLQFDPDTDIEVLAALCAEISNLLQSAPDLQLLIRKLENSLCNAIQLSERWPVRTENPAREMEKLAGMYLGIAQADPRRRIGRLLDYLPGYGKRMPAGVPLWGAVAAGQPIEAVQTQKPSRSRTW